MYIQSFHINSFGILQDVILENIPQGLSIFFGKNEAGKSTVLNFFRYMLNYSRSKKDDPVKKYLEKHNKSGGSLIVETNQYGSIHLSRNQKASLIITDNHGNILEQSLWENLFYGITQEVYTNIYSFSLNELQSFETLSSKDVRNALYGASFGTNISSPSEVINKLTNSMEKILGKKSLQAFESDFQEWEKITNQIKNAEKEVIDYDKTQNNLSILQKEEISIQELIKKLEKQCTLLEKKIDLWPTWEEWQIKYAEFTILKPVLETFPIDGYSQLKELIKKHEEDIQQITRITTRLNKIQDEITTIHVDTTLLEINKELQTIISYKTSFINAEQTIPKLKTDLKEKEKLIQQHITYLGENWSIEKVCQTNRSLEVREKIHSLHSEIKEAEQIYTTISTHLLEINKKLATAKEKKEKIDYEIHNSHKEKSFLILEQADFFKLQDLFKQYLGIINKTNNTYHTYLASKTTTGIKNYSCILIQVISFLAFIKGLSMVHTPLYVPPIIPYIKSILSTIPWSIYILAITSLPVFIASILYKYTILSKQINYTKQLYSSYETEKKTEKKLEQELQKICLQINITIDQLSPEYLTTLKDTINAKENFNNAYTHVQELTKEYEKLKEEQQSAKQAYDIICLKWNTYINENLSLPFTFSYPRVQTAFDCMDTIENLHVRCQSIKENLLQHEQDKNLLLLPLQNIAKKLEHSTDPIDWIAFLESLKEKSDQTLIFHNKQNSLKEQKTILLEELSQARTALERTNKKKQKLLQDGHAKHEEEFLNKALQKNHYETIKKDLDTIETRFKIVAEHMAIEPSILKNSFFTEEPILLEKNHMELLSQITTSKEQKEEIYKKIHEQELYLKNLASSTTLSQYRIQESIIRNAINETAKQWASFALANKLLMTAKSHFEQERQPEIIRAASNTFNTITNKKWKGVNASLEEMSLNVLPNHGEPINPTILSRGTQEQLYLALRLAHIQNHAIKATPLPIIMDDILVNFDQERALNTIKAFMKLLEPITSKEKRHQILFFTCHNHTIEQIREILPTSTLYVIENNKIRHTTN